MQLRDYQQETVDKNVAAMRSGVKSTLNHLFTGAGKTVVFVSLAGRIDGRTLIICHQRELVWQTIDKVREILGEDPGLEMASFVSREDEWFPTKVVVACYPTLVQKKGGDYRYKKFTDISLVIVDEAHTMCSPTAIDMLKWYQEGGAMVAGFTATPFRMDGRPMMRGETCSSTNSSSEGTTFTGPSTTDGPSPQCASSPGSKVLTSPA
jgi:superfamily II DNA or RNA helicase